MLTSEEGETSRQEKERNQAMTAFEDRIQELAIETYDRDYSHPGDVIDKKTKVKTSGYYDYEIVDRWSDAL